MIITVTGNIGYADREKVKKKLQAEIKSVLRAHSGEEITIYLPTPDGLETVAYEAVDKAIKGYNVKKVLANDNFKVMVQQGISFDKVSFIEAGRYRENPVLRSKWIVEHSDVLIFYIDSDLNYCGITYSYALSEHHRTGKPKVHRIY